MPNPNHGPDGKFTSGSGSGGSRGVRALAHRGRLQHNASNARRFGYDKETKAHANRVASRSKTTHRPGSTKAAAAILAKEGQTPRQSRIAKKVAESNQYAQKGLYGGAQKAASAARREIRKASKPSEKLARHVNGVVYGKNSLGTQWNAAEASKVVKSSRKRVSGGLRAKAARQNVASRGRRYVKRS